MAKRKESHGKGWLQRNVHESQRKEVAEHLRLHRKWYFALDSAYERRRDLEYLRSKCAFDLAEYLEKLLPKRGRLAVLDSGAGFFGVSGDLKRKFGKRVFVTGLTMVSPVLPKRSRVGMIALLKKLNPGYRHERLIEGLYGGLKKAEENSSLVDDVRVGVIENFSTRRRYGVILDVHGPLRHSRFQQRVIERYFNLLKPNGRVVMNVDFGVAEGAEMIVQVMFGEKSKIAQRTGYYFRMRQIPGSPIYELEKVPLHA